MIKKIGLALGSGAARGLAHIGVLEVLEEAGIPIDLISGTSMGAAVGALYAYDRNLPRIKQAAIELGKHRIFPLVDISLPKTGFISGKRVKDYLRLIIGKNIDFSDLAIPFSCVATDIISGEEIVIKTGPVIEAVRASISIPLLFTAIEMDNHLLVDGALVNPVPTNIVRDMGADYIIAVNVIPNVHDVSQWANHEGVKALKKVNILNIILQTFYISIYSMVKPNLKIADVIIEPNLADIRYSDFHAAEECIKRGRLAAELAVPIIYKSLRIRKKIDRSELSTGLSKALP